MREGKKPEINWDEDKIVSYSQFSMYQKCPKRWELGYARNLRSREPSIYFVFGNAIHATIQEWLVAYYKGENFDYINTFARHYKTEFENDSEKWGKLFSNVEELMEFYADGVAILNYLADNMDEYFDRDKYEYIGYELPMYKAVNEKRPNVKFMAFLDLVFRNKQTNMYEVRDIKTSTRGWSDYQMNDKTKLSQVLIYKYYFSKIYNIDMEDVIVDYIITKRKLQGWDNNHIQLFTPQQFEEDCAWMAMEFESFIEGSFTEDGEYNLDREYPAFGGHNLSNCRFCEFADNEELCPISKRK